MTHLDRAAAQRIAIGGALHDHAAFVHVASVTADHFDGVYRQLYDTMTDLALMHGKPCNPDTVSAETGITIQALTALAPPAPDLLAVEAALAVLTREPTEGSTLAALRRRMHLAETWITRDELQQLLDAYQFRVEQAERERQAYRAKQARSPWMQIASTEIDGLSKAVYADGTHPIEWAETTVEMHIDTFGQIVDARAENPDSHPGYFLELTVPALARRIVGALMEAGWKPPTVPAPADATGDA